MLPVLLVPVLEPDLFFVADFEDLPEGEVGLPSRSPVRFFPVPGDLRHGMGRILDGMTCMADFWQLCDCVKQLIQHNLVRPPPEIMCTLIWTSPCEFLLSAVLTCPHFSTLRLALPAEQITSMDSEGLQFGFSKGAVCLLGESTKSRSPSRTSAQKQGRAVIHSRRPATFGSITMSSSSSADGG